VEGLIELVAASFARHGIDCPGSELRPDLRSGEPASNAAVEPITNSPMQVAQASLSVALPEHNFGKGQRGDLAP
jgi:hypothetical protein